MHTYIPSTERTLLESGRFHCLVCLSVQFNYLIFVFSCVFYYPQEAEREGGGRASRCNKEMERENDGAWREMGT